MKTYRTILTIGKKNFCAFCGNEIQHDNDGQLLCHCENAKLYRNALHVALQLEIEANKTMKDAPKPQYELRTVCLPIQYNVEDTNIDDDEPSICV